jgi:ankyrin repeat protein
MTPLHYAVKQNNSKITQLLCQANARLNFQTNEGLTPLHYACKNGNLNIAMTLINKKAKIDLLDNHNNTPIMYSVRSRDGLFKYLLKMGADIKRRNDRGETLLHLACEAGNLEIVVLLLNNNLNVNDVDRKGQTPLHSVLNGNKSTDRKDIIRLLLEYKINVEIRSKEGKTGLQLLMEKGYYENDKDLLKTENNESGLIQNMNAELKKLVVGFNDQKPTMEMEKLIEKLKQEFNQKIKPRQNHFILKPSSQ